MIFKKTYTERFTVQPNSTINDSRISFGARGLLAYLLSKPKDWEVQTADLVNASPAGISAVTTMVNELIEHGYLVKVRTRNSAGVYTGQITEVYDEPQANYPQSGFPHVDKPHVDNHTLLNKEKKQNKEFTNNIPPPENDAIASNGNDGMLDPELKAKIRKNDKLINRWLGRCGQSRPTDLDHYKEHYVNPAWLLMERCSWDSSRAFNLLDEQRNKLLAEGKYPTRVSTLNRSIFGELDAGAMAERGQTGGKAWYEK